jgi:hypothetical protein
MRPKGSARQYGLEALGYAEKDEYIRLQEI